MRMLEFPCGIDCGVLIAAAAAAAAAAVKDTCWSCHTPASLCLPSIIALGSFLGRFEHRFSLSSHQNFTNFLHFIFERICQLFSVTISTVDQTCRNKQVISQLL